MTNDPKIPLPAAEIPHPVVLVKAGDVAPLDVGYRGLHRSGDVRNRDRKNFTEMFDRLLASQERLHDLCRKNDNYIANKIHEYDASLSPPRPGQSPYDISVRYHPHGEAYATYPHDTIWGWFNDYVAGKMGSHIHTIRPLEAHQQLTDVTEQGTDAIKKLALDIPQRFNEISLLRLTIRELRKHETQPDKLADYDTMLDRIGETRSIIATLWEMATHYVATTGKPTLHPITHEPVPAPQLSISDDEIRGLMRSQFRFVEDTLARLTRHMEQEPILGLLNEKRKQVDAEQGLTKSDAVGAYVSKPRTGWDGLRDYVKQKVMQKEMWLDRKKIGVDEVAARIIEGIKGQVNGIAPATSAPPPITPEEAAPGVSRYTFANYKTFDGWSHSLYQLLSEFEQRDGIDPQTKEACATAAKELRMLNRAMVSMYEFADMVIARTPPKPQLPPL